MTRGLPTPPSSRACSARSWCACPRDQRLSRGTPVALTQRTTQAAKALQFEVFPQSADGHAIFCRNGWE